MITEVIDHFFGGTRGADTPVRLRKVSIRHILVNLLQLEFLLFLFRHFFKFASSLFLFNDHEVLKQAVGQVLSHLLKLGAGELCIFVIVVKVGMETRFKRKAIHNVKLSPHHDPSSFQLGLLEPEAARVIPKLLSLFSYQFWDDSHLEVA